jgi:DNA-binding CsgD family transcriptional regulator
MYEITDSTTEEEIGDIILRLWKMGMSLPEIAQETSLSIGIVSQILKRVQKKLVKESG